MKLTPGTVYYVRLRMHDLRNVPQDPSKPWPVLKTVKIRRVFLGTERRLGEIPCANFSTRLTRHRPQGGLGSYLSVPHYDLLEAVEEDKYSTIQ